MLSTHVIGFYAYCNLDISPLKGTFKKLKNVKVTWNLQGNDAESNQYVTPLINLSGYLVCGCQFKTKNNKSGPQLKAGLV